MISSVEKCNINCFIMIIIRIYFTGPIIKNESGSANQVKKCKFNSLRINFYNLLTPPHQIEIFVFRLRQ